MGVGVRVVGNFKIPVEYFLKLSPCPYGGERPFPYLNSVSICIWTTYSTCTNMNHRCNEFIHLFLSLHVG